MNIRAKFLIVFASTSLVVLLLVGAVVGRSAPPEEPYKHLAVFTEVVTRIKSEYVEEPDMKSVTLGALNGLLESLDPFASYLNAEQYKEYNKKKDTLRGDVGLLISKRAGYIGVVGAVPESPAARAGLSPGDWIEAIKGVGTRDMPLAYAEIMLRGEPGSTVELLVLRSRRPEPQKLTLTRAVVSYPQVRSEMLANQIGYLRPETLAPGRLPQVAAAIESLGKQGAKRWLLDLRNCSVGAPEEGLELANFFVERGLLGYVQGQKVPRQDFEADARKTRTRLPMQVVINRGTAWGCEVAAAALLDAKRADLVGERTYGAASVRRAVQLDDGGAVILAVAKYYAPGGKSIPDNGVMPQTLLPEPEAQIEFDDEGKPIPPLTEERLKDQSKQLGTYLNRVIELIEKK